MELPITRPSMICYADEIEFPEFLNDLSAKKHNGFIRITSGSEEGYILFKEGKEIAASYERHSRVDAIENIKAATDNNGTLIEIFDVRPSQIDFFMDINKPYIIGSAAYDLIDELKGNKEFKEPEPKTIPKPMPVSEAITENISQSTITETVESNPNPKTLQKPVDVGEEELSNGSAGETVESKPITNYKTESAEEFKIASQKSGTVEPSITNPSDDSNIETVIETVKTEPVQKKSVIPEPSAVKTEYVENKSVHEDINSTPEANDEKSNDAMESPEIAMDRSELMKKYGIKDIQEKDVDNILESYKGGYVSDDDVEKIELTLMNKIKKSLLGIPKIRGAEVMVFLENIDGLSGKVNIIIESESKGLLSRIMRESKDINLERQIIEISQIEIRKSFRKYPEIVDKFEVNVEIS